MILQSIALTITSQGHPLTYSDDLFIEVKTNAEPATLFGWTKTRSMIKQVATDFHEQLGFKFQVLLSPRSDALQKLESPSCPTI